jgi:predicted phage terminase large subunit-like protein
MRRRRARASLVDFSQAIDIPGKPASEDPDEWLFKPIETQVAKHHILFMQEAQACIEKPFGRLILMAPPGSAKSIYIGAVLPAWAMQRTAGYKVISTSYAATPAYRSSKRCQQICRSQDYAALSEGNATLRRGYSAVDEWELTNGSGMLAAGILGGITSARADLVIIDDPVSGREDADSEQMRRKTKNAYDDDVLTRIKPDASIIIIMTRWHEDDLVGSNLPEGYKGESGDILCRDGQVWRVICIPAECERKDDPLKRKVGEMLWPEWFTKRHWSNFRQNPRTWSALYQQRPAPETGGQFERSDFRRYTETPKGLKFWLSSDFAVTKKEIGNRPDFTEHQVWGLDHDTNLYLEHGISLQSEPEKTVAEAVMLIPTYKPLEWLIEAGTIYNAMNGTINREMRDKKKYTVLEKMPSGDDKIAKAAAFRIMARSGKVWVKEGPYGDAFIAQLCSFPFGAYDDKVDAAGQLARRIDEMYAPKEPPPEKRRRGVKPFTDEMLQAIIADDEAAEKAKRRFMG